MSISSIRLEVIERPFSDSSLEDYFQWWTEQTKSEPHMLDETPESLKETLLIGLLAFEKNRLVAASGIFPARTKTGEHLSCNGKLLVELGSNVVELSHRGSGIGTEMTRRRLDISRKKDWATVSVTTNPIIHHIFKSIGGIVMNGQVEFKKIREDLCLCNSRNEQCKICPLKERACWIFP